MDPEAIQLSGLIVGAYSIYMICHVIAGSLVPDGIILSGIIGTICTVCGVKIGSTMEQQKLRQEPTALAPVERIELSK